MLQIFGKQTESTAALQQACGNINLRLRWGGNFVPKAINGEVHLLNGLEQLQAMQEAGIKCPEFVTELTLSPPPREEDPNALTGIWLARKLNHTQGLDIIASNERMTARKRFRFNDRPYWTKYTPASAEWRLHIIKFARGYKCIGRSLKTPPTIVDFDAAPPAVVIRSRRLGWHMRHDVEPPKGLRTIAKAAVEACKYELGAVDILQLGDGNFSCLEVNSRPATRDNYTISAYASAFTALAAERN